MKVPLLWFKLQLGLFLREDTYVGFVQTILNVTIDQLLSHIVRHQLDGFFSIWHHDKKVVWRQHDMFSIILHHVDFRKKLQSFMTPLNEWFGLQTSTIAMILYQFCELFFFFFFFNMALFYLQIWQMTAWKIVTIEWGQL